MKLNLKLRDLLKKKLKDKQLFKQIWLLKDKLRRKL